MQTRDKADCTRLDAAFLSDHPIMAYILLEEAGNADATSWEVVLTIARN